MKPIKVRLFGGVAVYRGTSELPPFPTQKSQNLLAFMALKRGRLLSRDALVGQFWRDRPESNGRKALRTELWRIRSVLEPEGVPAGTYVRTDGQRAGFTPPDDSWVDVWEFEDRLAGLDSLDGELEPDRVYDLVRAVKLYRGDLMDGVYDEWCLSERDRLKLMLLTALEALTHHHRCRGELTAAITWGRRLLRHDPFREHIHRELMLCHYAMGDRPLAIRQYRECAEVLRTELEIEPMQETTALYEQLQADWPSTGPSALPEVLPRYRGSDWSLPILPLDVRFPEIPGPGGGRRRANSG